ncbi:hypothetical protein BDR04DRAFT_1152320 [Suillus decipiens]|nr:hypothetical protein BDR04DRAFT_1152320 [Suillus decipiens]
MSSNTATSAAANQALIAFLDRLNELVEQVLQSQSEEEKMRMSLNIASQLAQRGNVHLVQIPDWNRVGHNDDICQGHPLYPKTLASAPVAIPTAGPSLPVPAPAPIPEPAPAPIPAPAPAPAHSPSKSCKRQFSTSPPHPVKRARKTTPKSKQILTDTDSNGNTVHLEKGKVKGKAKAKAKARTPSPSPDADQQELDVHCQNTTHMVTRKALLVVVIWTRPMSSAKNKDDDEDDSQPMGQVIVKLAKGREQSKASTHQTGPDKVKGKGKHPQPPEQPDTLITPTGPTPTPILSVAPITTHSKTTRKGKTGENSKGTDINTPRPAPIPEELAVNIKMLDDPPAGTNTSLPDTAPDAAPLASTDNFPLDH